MTKLALLPTLSALFVGGAAHSAFVLHNDFSQWSADAGSFETITFGEIAPFSLVTNQYAPMGLLFVDLDGNWTEGPEYNPYPQDGFGLDGQEVIDITLTKDAFAIGAHFPGIMRYRLFQDGALVCDSDLIGGSGYNFFGGVVSSDIAFDRVLLNGQPFGDEVFLDNLYISFVPVPAPAAVGALVALSFGWTRRRRSGLA